MSLYDKLSVGFGSGFGVGVGKLFSLKPTDGAGDFTVVRADADATELVTNGSFASDTAWTKGNGWSIGGGLATTTGATGGITQSISILTGVKYYVEITTIGGSYSSGGLKVRLGGDGNLASIVEDGSYVFELTSEGTTDIGFFVDSNNSFIGSIDDISVKSAEFSYAATRINKQGLVEGVRPNTPRSNYPIGGSINGCPYLLLEPSIENLMLKSEDFNDAAWSKSNVTITIDDSNSPNSTLTADKIEATSTSGAYVSQTKTVTLGDVLVSLFVKKGSVNNVLFFLINGSNEVRQWFNVSSGTIGTNSDVNTPNTKNIKIEDYGDYYRCSLVFTASNTSVNNRFYIAENDGAFGQQIGDYIYFWGAEIKQGNYLTTYIPTSGSSVTRQKDEINSSGDSSYFNDNEGVLVVHAAALVDDLSNRIISVSDGTVDNIVSLGYNTITNQIEAKIVSEGITQAQLVFTISNILDFNKFAIRYKENDFSFWVNGGEVATDINGDVPIGLNTLNFDDGSGGNTFIGKCLSLMYFFEYLSNEEMQNLTLENNFEFESGDAYIFD